ncbi:MAG: hypothetical protein ACOX6N_01125 [Patescibacteria group bacterium]
MGLFHLLILLLTQPIFAQTSTDTAPWTLYQKYKNDYYYQYNNYQTSLSQFEQKKQIDSKYKSITTSKEKNEAFIKSYIARNNALDTYCRTLRVKLSINQQYNPQNTKIIQGILAQKENLLQQENQKVQDIDITDNSKLQDTHKQFEDKLDDIKKNINTALVEDNINYNLSLIDHALKLSDEISKDPQNDDNTNHILKAISLKLEDYRQESISKTTYNPEAGKPTKNPSSSLNDLDAINQQILDAISNLKSIIQN